MARISKLELNEAVTNLRAVGMDLDIEGAEYWSVENPFGPTGLHLVERRTDQGNSVSQNTALGTFRWGGPKEAHAAVVAMYRALLAARNAQVSMDATARREDPLAVNP